jgi:ADP-ribosyl-[dinitrogen reductase] hydrolase
MEWHHLPIRDVSVPDAAFERSWPADAARLRALIDAGANVLIHCKGGLGRTGMVAARLLVERGADPAAAMRDVRAVRPG